MRTKDKIHNAIGKTLVASYIGCVGLSVYEDVNFELDRATCLTMSALGEYYDPDGVNESSVIFRTFNFAAFYGLLGEDISIRSHVSRYDNYICAYTLSQHYPMFPGL